MILNGERKLLLFFLHSLCIAGLENFGELIQQVVVFDLAKLLFAVLVFYDFKDVQYSSASATSLWASRRVGTSAIK